LQVGAKPSETAETLLRKEGVLYKKHLLGGIKKGAFDETVADEKFQAWLEQKRKSEETIVEKLSSESKKDAEKRIEAEKKVNEARAEKIAAKLKQEEVVESTTEENVESTDSNVEETAAE
jgi:small subunit ribosomal protein S16